MSAHPPSLDEACPATSTDPWFDPILHLRGPVFDGERLARHAGEVAAAQGRPERTSGIESVRGEGRGASLGSEFAVMKRAIAAAYAALAAPGGDRRNPMPAEEWLLDNAFIVEEQLREVEVD